MGRKNVKKRRERETRRVNGRNLNKRNENASKRKERET